MQTTATPSPKTSLLTTSLLLVGACAWFTSVVVASTSGALGALAGRFMPAYAVLVVIGIATPVLTYYASRSVRSAIDAIGIRQLTLMHAWRIAAAFAFFYYGSRGSLPVLFWVPAGVGDLLAGAYALSLTFGDASIERYRRVHRFGFADFVSAVGLGLTFTLLGDPRMEFLTTLPMALIPLFGVGLSGASHIIALTSLLRRRTV
jgi:hypothetical protein